MKFTNAFKSNCKQIYAVLFITSNSTETLQSASQTHTRTYTDNLKEARETRRERRGVGGRVVFEVKWDTHRVPL